jgi:hypothetical protein
MPLLGLRGTGQFGVDLRPTNYRELYTLLEPNGTAPLNAVLAMTQAEPTDDPKYNNFRDELPDRKLKIVKTGGYTASDTTLQLVADASVAYVLKGSVIVNAATGEVMHATADANVGASTISVTRNIGSTSFTIADGADLFIAGFAAAEGSGAPSAVSFDPTVDYNYTQIFKTPFTVTNTLDATYRRTGNALQEYREKALKLHMSDIERAMLFGKRSEVNGSTAQPLRFTGGLSTMIPNVIDVSTFSSPNVMTEKQFDRSLIENIFAFGSKQKIAWVGATVAANLMEIGKNRWAPQQIDDAYGVAFTRYTTFAGDLMVYVHPQFRQIPGMASAAVIVDLPYLRYRYLQGRDTTLIENIQGTDEDCKKHQYLTECGLEMLQAKVHTLIKGWTKVS